MKDFGTPKYGMTRDLGKIDIVEARKKVEKALQDHGFGVLTEIDVRATFKKKLDIEHTPYIILGACNPKLAHMALNEEPGIGLLLPCNVVLAQNAEGDVIVSAIEPTKMFEVVDRPEVAGLAEEVKGLLTKALAQLQ